MCRVKIRYNLTKSQRNIAISVKLLVNLTGNSAFIVRFCGINYVIKKVIILSGILNKLVKLIVSFFIPIINDFGLRLRIEGNASFNRSNDFILCIPVYDCTVFPNRFPIGSRISGEVISNCLKCFGLTVFSDLRFNALNRLQVKIVFSVRHAASCFRYDLVYNGISDLLVYISPYTRISGKIITGCFLCPIHVINKLRAFCFKLILDLGNDITVESVIVIYILTNILVKLFCNKSINLSLKRSVINWV